MDDEWKWNSVTYREGATDGEFGETMVGSLFLTTGFNRHPILVFYKKTPFSSKTTIYENSYGKMIVGAGTIIGFSGLRLLAHELTGKPNRGNDNISRFARDQWDEGWKNVKEIKTKILSASEYRKEIYFEKCICKYYRNDGMLLLCFKEEEHNYILCIPDRSRNKKRNDVLLEQMKQCKELKRGL